MSLSDEGGVAFAEMAQQAAKVPEKAAEPDLVELANACMLKADGEIDEAAKMFLSGMRRQHPGYYAEMESKVMRGHAIAMLRHITSSIRRSIAATAGGTKSDGLSARSMAAFARKWMDWPVMPGQPLGEATRPILLSVSTSYLRNAATSSARGKWLEAIAQKLKDDKTKVAAVLDEAAVAKVAKEFGVVQES